MKVRISFLFLTGMIILILFPKFIKIKTLFRLKIFQYRSFISFFGYVFIYTRLYIINNRKDKFSLEVYHLITYHAHEGLSDMVLICYQIMNKLRLPFRRSISQESFNLATLKFIFQKGPSKLCLCAWQQHELVQQFDANKHLV